MNFLSKSIVGAIAAGVAMVSSAASATPKLPCDTAQLIVPWKPGGGTQVLYALVEKTISELDTPYNLKVVTVPGQGGNKGCLLYTSPSPRDGLLSRMPSSA